MAHLAAWPQRRTFLREGLILAGYMILPVVLSGLLLLGAVLLTPGSWAFPVSVACGVLWFTGSLVAYKLAVRHFRTVRSGAPAVRLYADRLEVDRPGQPPWTFARDPAFGFELRWFVGWHQGTGSNRGYTSTSQTRLSQGEQELVVIADGDLTPIYAHPELGRNDTELFEGWRELPRVRMWPGDLVELLLKLRES